MPMGEPLWVAAKPAMTNNLAINVIGVSPPGQLTMHAAGHEQLGSQWP